MKKFVVLFFAVMLAVSFVSCKKEIIMPSINRTDKPAKEMWNNASDYGTFSSVYIEQEDIDAAIYMSKYCTSDYTYVDNNGNIRNQIEFTDYFRLPAKKYFGIYKNIPTVSVSTDYYLISASVLSQAKDITSRKGATICDLDYPTIPLDTRWRSISNAN